MAMSWMSDVSQITVLQEARQFAVRHKDPSFAEVVGRYRTIGFDVLAVADRMLALADEGMALRGKVDAAQGRYELESAGSRDAVREAARWLRKLSLGARYASVSDHPAGAALQGLFSAGNLPADSSVRAQASLAQALEQLSHDDLAAFGLGAPFVAEGRALAAELVAEAAHPLVPESQRMLGTERLHAVLDEIVALFERTDAAREFVMELTGKELPGFSLTLARGAQGGGGSDGGPTGSAPPAGEDDKGL